MVTKENGVWNTYGEYFKTLLNVDDGREAELTQVQLNGMDRNVRMTMELTHDKRKAVKKFQKGSLLE